MDPNLKYFLSTVPLGLILPQVQNFMEDFIARNQRKLYEAWSAIAMSQEIKYESFL